MSQEPAFAIGELAARAGLKADTLRYYERLGMISPAGRTTGGFRMYSADVVERLRYRPGALSCVGERCDVTSSIPYRRITLWIVTLVVCLMLTATWWANWVIYWTL
jgi:hypothetical protein